MKSKKLIIAVALGLIAGGLHLTYVRGLENRKQGGKLVSVLAVSKKIDAGQKVSKAELGARSIPAAYLDPRSITEDKLKEIDGLTASMDMEPGQIVQWTDFTARLKWDDGDLSKKIESGKRAVTISVDKSLSMGGLLRPGHRVDILGTFTSKGSFSIKEKISATLLQNVLVLATGSSVTPDEDGNGTSRFSTVTLSVGLEEAEVLALATTSGKLSIVLRGRQDLSIVHDVPEKKMEDVWNADRRAALQTTNKSKTIQGIERLRAE